MLDLAALVLTYNEQENIRRTLEQLRWLPHVVVVDSNSTDETVTIARSFPNVTVVGRKFDTHAQQWNFGLAQIATQWVLALDADYLVSAELARELQELPPSDDVSGYNVNFVYQIHGRSLRSSVYPAHAVLFRRNRASYYDDGHTQKLRINGRVPNLGGVIFHDDRKPLSRWIQSQDRYAKLEARHLLELRNADGEGRSRRISMQDRLRLRVYYAAPVMFLYLLFGRMMILDGWPGWYYVMQRTIAEMLLSLRLLTERERLDGVVAAERSGDELSENP